MHMHHLNNILFIRCAKTSTSDCIYVIQYHWEFVYEYLWIIHFGLALNNEETFPSNNIYNWLLGFDRDKQIPL